MIARPIHFSLAFAVVVVALAACAVAPNDQNLQPTPVRDVVFSISIDTSDDALPPLRIALWRPAASRNAPAMTLAAYAQAFCAEEGRTAEDDLAACYPRLAEAVQAAENPQAVFLLDVGERPMLASSSGAPAVSEYPLVIIAGSFAGGGRDFVRLAERLALSGFVVAVIDDFDGAAGFNGPTVARKHRQLQRTLDILGADPGIDETSVALIGWSFSGVPMAVFTTQQASVRAFISLDSGLRYEYGSTLAKQSDAFEPLNTDAALLLITAGIDNPVAKDNSALSMFACSDRLEMAIPQYDHGAFNDQDGLAQAMMAMSPSKASQSAVSPSEADQQAGFEKMVRTITLFLDSSLHARGTLEMVASLTDAGFVARTENPSCRERSN